MALDKALKNLKFDARMTEFNLDNGVISKEELKAHLDSLQDSGANSEKLNIEENSRSSSDTTQH
ncbi:MAG: hypothetical protein ACAH59_06470 [Pseudobdellovibrionaceae bacterium]